MTSEDRYYIYNFTFGTNEDGDQEIVFSRPGDDNESPDYKNKPIAYALKDIMVCTIDTVDEKNVCRQQRFFAMNLLIKKSRKIYFTTHEQLLNCMNRIIELQGFGKLRKNQYEILEQLAVSEDDDCERYLVRHRNTRRYFVMKSVNESMPSNLFTVATSEREILLRCGKIS